MEIINAHQVIFMFRMKSAVPHQEEFYLVGPWGPLKLTISDWRSQSGYSLNYQAKFEESCTKT